MELLYNFVQGVVITVSVLFTFLLLFVLVAAIKKGKTSEKELIKAFKKFRQKQIEKDDFSNLEEVDKIISELKEGNKPPEIKNYSIKRDGSLKITEIGDSQEIKIITKFKIKRK